MIRIVTNWIARHLLIAVLVSGIVGTLIISIGIGLLLQSHFDTVANAQRAQIVAGCRRLNVKQVQDNRNQYADYTFDVVFTELLKHPMMRQTEQQKHELKIFLAPLLAAGRAKAWVPLVDDCSSVSVHYLLPRAIPFYQQTPPRSALVYP